MMLLPAFPWATPLMKCLVLHIRVLYSVLVQANTYVALDAGVYTKILDGYNRTVYPLRGVGTRTHATIPDTLKMPSHNNYIIYTRLHSELQSRMR